MPSFGVKPEERNEKVTVNVDNDDFIMKNFLENSKTGEDETSDDTVDNDSNDTLNENSDSESASIPVAGDRNRYIYFNTISTGSSQNCELISLGLIDADGNTFYAEFNDYDKSLIANLSEFEDYFEKTLINPETVTEGEHWTITSNRSEIRVQLLGWLSQRCGAGKTIQFVTDIAHYKFMLLINLITAGHIASSIPEQVISLCCVDINQDIASSMLTNEDIDYTDSNFIPLVEAFHISRKDLIDQFHPDNNIEFKTALDYAKGIKIIHQCLWGIE